MAGVAGSYRGRDLLRGLGGIKENNFIKSAVSGRCCAVIAVTWCAAESPRAEWVISLG